jgi:hypothetical protein
MEAVEEAADLRTLPARVIGQLQRRGGQRGAEITTREAVHDVLATHEGRGELGIRAGHGTEGLGRPAGRRGLARGDGIQSPQAGIVSRYLRTEAGRNSFMATSPSSIRSTHSKVRSASPSSA